MPPKKKRAQPSGPSYVGEVFCFTGFRDKELSDLVEAAGGTVAGSMTKAVTCVVCKSGSESTKKVQDAVNKGLKLMTKTELEDELKVGNESPTFIIFNSYMLRVTGRLQPPLHLPRRKAEEQKQ